MNLKQQNVRGNRLHGAGNGCIPGDDSKWCFMIKRAVWPELFRCVGGFISL